MKKWFSGCYPVTLRWGDREELLAASPAFCTALTFCTRPHSWLSRDQKAVFLGPHVTLMCSSGECSWGPQGCARWTSLYPSSSHFSLLPRLLAFSFSLECPAPKPVKITSFLSPSLLQISGPLHYLQVAVSFQFLLRPWGAAVSAGPSHSWPRLAWVEMGEPRGRDQAEFWCRFPKVRSEIIDLTFARIVSFLRYLLLRT